MGLIIQLVYGGLTGASAELFEGIASLSATAVLTYMIVWMSQNANKIKSEVRYKIDAKFREQKISIPFPQRDVHLFQHIKSQ